MSPNKLTELYRELKIQKDKKWKAESELITAGDKIRKIEKKIEKEIHK